MTQVDPAWDALLARHLAGQLNEDDRRILNDRLRADASARRDFAEMLNLDATLAVAAAGANEERRARQTRRKRLLHTIATATMALSILATGSWWWVRESSPHFATVLSAEGSLWKGPVQLRGKMQSLPEGVLALQTATGNKIILEGPATFRFVSAQELRLTYGRALAIITPQGKGFTVLTPAGKIVDLGTEFGVQVEADGTSEVQVFLGSVVITPKLGGSDRSVSKGEALTMPGDGSPPGTLAPGRRQFFDRPEAVQALRNEIEATTTARPSAGTPATPRIAHGQFCNPGHGTGLPGVVYDFKQSPLREDLPFDPNRYFQTIKALGAAGFPATETGRYFHVPPVSRRFAWLLMPVEEADTAPWVLGADQTMRPTGWVAHYSGMVAPPAAGEWRFTGYFDDALAVYVNGKPVLDGSRDEMINADERQPDPELRQPYGTREVLNGRGHVGRWVRLDGPFRIDILVGERVGAQMGGVLLVENRRTAYSLRGDGSPILPPFVTRQLSQADRAAIQAFSDSPAGFPVETQNIPVFSVTDHASPSR